MTLIGKRKILVTGVAAATLVLGLYALPGTAPSYGGESPGRENGPVVSEPLFGFLLSLANGDSLGSWAGQDIF